MRVSISIVKELYGSGETYVTLKVSLFFLIQSETCCLRQGAKTYRQLFLLIRKNT